MSRNSSRHAQRLGHPGAFQSTAGITADAGKYQMGGEARSTHHKNRTRQRRLDAGLCIACGKVPPTEGSGHSGPYTTCASCREKQRQYALAFKRRHADEQEPPMTMMAERLQGANEINEARSRFALQPNSKILVVGGRTTNLQRQAREHPRVIVWESTHLQGRREPPTLPSNVSVVMLSRFCSHHVTDYLRSETKKSGAFLFSGLLQTGQIRSHMATLLGLNAQTVAEGDDIGETIIDAPGMNPLAVKRDFLPTRIEPAEPTEVTSTPAPVASSEEQMEARLEEAVRLVTESMAALSVVRDELQATRDVIHQNREQLQTLRQLKSLLGKI